MGFTSPFFLLLLPLALLPLLLHRTPSNTYSAISMLPYDALSSLLGKLLKIIGGLGLLFIILGLAGPHSLEQTTEKTGIGAQIALVLDRSASMDDPFSGSNESGKVGETKSAAASRLMGLFVKRRSNDMMGMVTFSNSAMYVLPLTENKEAILGAIKATAGNSLFQTNIGAGLSSGASLFEKMPDSGSRALILLSDGAGRVSTEVQQKVREWLERMHITVYWIVLRKPGGLSIFDKDYKPKEGEALPPEVELHEYFKTLRTPFNAYEAEDPKSLDNAIRDIDAKEKKAIIYHERIPGHDFTPWAYALAMLMIALLLAVKLLEVKTWRKIV